MTRRRSGKIFDLLKSYYGEPDTDLRFDNLYQLAVSVVLSAQTTDKQVNAATPGLFHRFRDFSQLAKAPVEEVERLVKSTGFFRAKAKNIINLAKAVMEKHQGMLPGTRDELMKLPGIGRKTANVILSVGFNIPAFAVDTHILRLSSRMGFSGSKNPITVEEAITATLPPEKWKEAHLLLIRHGRKLCSSRKPLCGECPVSALCDYPTRLP